MHIDDPAYDLSYPSLPEMLRKTGEKLLVSFYTEILSGAGFSGLRGQITSTLNRSILEADCWNSNGKGARVCPACLGILLAPIKNTSQIDCDHFFPKSCYPPLSIHPYNLIFVCMQCNERRHKEKDPIDNHRPGAIEDCYIPYLRSGIHEISVHFRPASPTAVVSIRAINNSPKASIRLSNLDRVYNISETWSVSLHTIHDEIIESIIANKKMPTENGVKRKLIELAGLDDVAKLTLPNNFLRSLYASWLSSNRLNIFVAECITRYKERLAEMA